MSAGRTGAASVSPIASIGGYEARSLDVAGTRTRLYDVGEGPPMLLIHGADPLPERSANVWVPVFDALSRSFRIVAPDKRGNGLTEPPVSVSNYTVTTQLDHLRELMRAVGKDGVHLVGQSRGAYLAARLAMEEAHLVRSLVLVDSATLAPEIGDYPSRKARVLDALPQDGRARFRSHHERLSYSHQHITDEYVAAGEFLQHTEIARRIDEALAAGAGETFRESLRAQRPETVQWLSDGRLGCPTLIYWGANDPTATLAQGVALFEFIASANARTRMSVVARAGHFPFREQPDDFASQVIAFVRQWGA